MTKLIIICGLPGSGKTTIAEEVSRYLKITCLSKDIIKEELFDSMKLSTLEDSKRIGGPSIRILLKLAEQQIANGVSVIIEAPFNFCDDYKIFETWEKKYSINLYSFVCSIDENLRLERFKKRNNRHYSHFDELRLRDHFTDRDSEVYTKMPGKIIFVDTSKSLDILTKEVISEIN